MFVEGRPGRHRVGGVVCAISNTLNGAISAADFTSPGVSVLDYSYKHSNSLRG